MFGDKKKKTEKKSNGKEKLPKVKKVDANGEKQRIPKGYKATVSKSGTIIMVSKSTDLSGKPKKEKKPVKPSAAKKKTTAKKTPAAKQTSTSKKSKQVKKAPKVEEIMHDDNYERGTDVGKPIVIKTSKAKHANRKELRRVAKVGGYTVFDGPRAGKTFETPKEAAEYAADLLKRTGIIYKVEKTDRQVSHTYKAESKTEK